MGRRIAPVISMKIGFSFLLSVAIGALTLGAADVVAVSIQRRAAVQSHEAAPYQAPAEIAALPRDQLLAEGHRLYMKSCAHCHGTDATGDEGPDLHEVSVSDRRIATVIRKGIKGEMPSFAKKHNTAEIAEIVAYVRSLEE